MQKLFNAALTAQTELILTAIDAGSHEIQIVFKDSIIIKDQIYTAEGKHITYLLKKGSKAWKLSLYAEEPLTQYNDIDQTNGQSTRIISTENSNANVVNLDTIRQLSDSVETLVEPIGCDSLTASYRFINLKTQCENLIFESERMGLLNAALNNFCISVDQLAELLNLLDYEENKLLLITSHLEHIHNLRKLPDLTKQFVLQTSKQAFEQILKSNPYQQLIKTSKKP